MPIDRRSVLTLAGLSMVASAAKAQTAASDTTASLPAGAARTASPAPPPDMLIPIWPGTPPGGMGRKPLSPSTAPPTGNQRNIDVPTLSLYRAADPDGSCVILAPGGAYTFVSITNEGTNVAQKLIANRTTALVLAYRLPGEGWADRGNVPLQDMQRAIRLVKSRAAEFGIDPAKLGVCGFSAGGHLASNLATLYDRKVYDPIDAIDTQSAKPAFAGLIYPIISLNVDPTHARNLALLGPTPTQQELDERSSERHVTAQTPPCFLAHCFADPTSPVRNTEMMTAALRTAKVPCETHYFQEGGHGFGIGSPNLPNGLWSDLFLRWMRRL